MMAQQVPIASCLFTLAVFSSFTLVLDLTCILSSSILCQVEFETNQN